MALDDDIARLESAPLLGLLGRDALRLLSFAGERRDLVRGEVLYRRGEASDGGYVLLSGLVAITRPGADPVLAGPGALFGRSALFSPGPRPATVAARERSVLLRVTPALMRRVLEEFPEGLDAVRAALADELDEMSAQFAAVRGRLDAL